MANSPSTHAKPEHERPEVGSRLLNAEQAARYLGISPRKLWELKQCGAIDHVSIGRRVLFDHQDLEAFIDRSRKGVGDSTSRA